MATNQIDSRSSIDAAPVAGFSVTDIAQAIVMPLASLRFTVALLFLAVLMTWVATLEQAYDDVFNVKIRHFSSLLVEVPVQVFFPPAWAPNLQNIPGRIFLPSGVSILVLMIVNLTAAHSLRFKIQASGSRLVAGIFALLAAAAITFVVIANGQGSGVQTDPWIAYNKIWIGMLAALLILALGSIATVFVLPRQRTLERAILLYMGLIGVLAAIVLLFFVDAYIGDSAMRILWQLAQATVAAIAGFVACVFLFKRKAGMVLLHIGVMGLMLNEILVTTAHKEFRLIVAEGQTSSELVDIRYHEMAVIDVSDPKVDRIVTVPADKLASLETISSPELPFDIRCVRYLRNSTFGSAKTQTENLATAGVGLNFELAEVPPVAGTDSAQETNTPAAFVELFNKKTGDSLGIYTLSSRLKSEFADRVTVDGKDFHILFRVETLHKPYQVTLNDAIREDYPGSTTPKYYGSEVTINDQSTGEITPQRIFMNNPLRYGGETFYQSGMPDPLPGESQYSIFQVVTNVGWMIPYVCCMYTVVGLLGQFVQSLLAHLNKQIVTAGKPAPAAKLAKDVSAGEAPRSRSWLLWLPALVVVGLMATWPAMQFDKASKEITRDGMRLDLLGQVPVTFEGRVQPLDSFARNTLLQLRHRESATDGKEKSQPAIAWLADAMFDLEAFDDYRTFYMTDPNVKNALDLPSPTTVSIKRKKYVYTVGEILSCNEKLRELIPNPKEVPEEKWTPLQRQLELLRRSTMKLKSAQFVFGPPRQEYAVEYAEFLAGLRASTQIPFVVASHDDEKPWSSMAKAMGPSWISSIADGAKTVDTVAEKISLEYWSDEELLEPALLRAMVKPSFRQTMPDTVVALMGTAKGRQELLQLLPEEIRQTLTTQERHVRDSQLVSMLTRINDGKREIAEKVTVPKNIELLMKLKPAYLAGDAATFNQTLETYLASINETPPLFYSPWRNRLERTYSAVSPFYLASAIYVFALLFVGISWTGLAWQGWRISMGRVAVGLLLLGLLVHTIGIVMRVGISGRPPVTNLYSSVLFVTAAGIAIALLMELFTKMSVGTKLGALSGIGGLLWAYSMTTVDGDTFSVMQAVLDTTFWLATHVIMISLGYAATFMAGLLGLVYLFGWVFTPAFSSKQNSRLFSNMLYGIVCFGLLASFFGTVLGGLWGDDSWGRFWGWDPKENGALMIVLWNALILHARWGGLVKERGVAALAVLGNIIVLWSWKGVNLLGVGLHAYAASEDKTLNWILLIGLVHLIIACVALLPAKFRLFGERA